MILIVDDDIGVRSSLSFVLERAGYESKAVASPREAIDIVKSVSLQLVLLDMNFTLTTDGQEGIILLKQIKLFAPDTPVILMTAWGSIDLAVKGMQSGAFDFITKPWNNILLLQRIETALQISRGGKESVNGVDDGKYADNYFDRSGIIGDSRAMNEVIEKVRRISRTNASVLITGESGTGKEMIAELIHKNSSRSGNPFVKVNLGGVSNSLFESEMFGHKKGAFTDALSDREGRFAVADKGTIFLDEIGELDLSCQVKLLRVLQEQTFEPLGESKVRRVDVRVVCATNADLKKMITEGSFREDLFYRINLITIHLPALRERREDIPLLVNYFAEKQCHDSKIDAVSISGSAMDFLCGLPYRGNIRELKNLIDRTILVSGKSVLNAEDFKAQYDPLSSDSQVELMATGSESSMTLEEMEHCRILEALENNEGNLVRTARALGISRGALYRRLQKYGIRLL